MTPSSFHQALADVAARLDGQYPGVTTSLRFDLGERGTFRLIVEQGACRVELGEGEAAATIAASEQDALDLLSGKLEATHALHTGRITTDGSFQALRALAAALSAPQEDPGEPLLTAKYPPESLGTLLLPRSEWRPFPNIDDRDAWAALPATVREALAARGEGALESEWSQLLATRYLDYARDGNRSRFQGLAFSRRGKLAGLVIAEGIENQGRYLDEIANGIWLICEESSWCVPAHIGGQRAGTDLPDPTEPIVDLFAAETSALLAWTDYLLGHKLAAVSPLVRPRLRREIQQRILTPCLERDDYWWMGFVPRRVNNWNPWINSNWLTSALLVEGDPERRLAAVAKSMRSIDRFVGPYPRDGGCDEGPGYWGRAGASLLDCLELLPSASEGQIDLYDEPLVQEIGRFILRVQIDGSYFVNFADAAAIVRPARAVV